MIRQVSFSVANFYGKKIKVTQKTLRKILTSKMTQKITAENVEIENLCSNPVWKHRGIMQL